MGASSRAAAASTSLVTQSVGAALCARAGVAYGIGCAARRPGGVLGGLARAPIMISASSGMAGALRRRINENRREGNWPGVNAGENSFIKLTSHQR